MNTFWNWLAKKGQHSLLHTISLAALVLAVFIINTAADMGPFGPLLASAGIYLAIFVALLQLFHWASTGLRVFASRRAK
ncbi:hypothetical protein [Herbaspirillum huttiense]|uniref:hypothetical protein n=1 Tax=Herbaspirillum huttiense TaxID=863372 RepID=UPI002176ED9A|nr:hypothetical protein [Herbaspirillum huttiense]UWE19357.1 hypothetical protein NY669_26645 [Herbaspirillum huttiense]